MVRRGVAAPAAEQHFGQYLEGGEFDPSDPETYQMMATLAESRRKKETEESDQEDPENPGERLDVYDRLLPYILLNDLQHQAPAEVALGVVERIVENRARCAPLLWAALRDWAVHPKSIQPKAVAMWAAMLGEIGGVELLPGLLELVMNPDHDILLHAGWAIHRLWERFPQEVLAAFRERARTDSPMGRCVIAEELAMAPSEVDIRPLALSLLEGFRGFADSPAAPYLLLTVAFALETRKEGAGAPLITRYGEMLSRKNREWVVRETEAEEGFIPRMLGHGIDQANIRDVCVDRMLMLDEEDEEDEDEEDDDGEGAEEDDLEEDDEDDEDEDEWDEDGEDQETMPVVAAPRPGRNDPCWCGSGKKYKKCHLEADEAERSSTPAPAKAGKPAETDNQAHKRLANLVMSSLQRWWGEAEMNRAMGQYFGSGGLPPELDQEASDLFLQWYVHDYRPKGARGPGFAEYLYREGHRTSERDRAMLESMRDARYGIYEVQRVEEGRGMEVMDLYRGDRFFVEDKAASKELVQWDRLLTRVEHFEGRYMLAGNGSLVPPAVAEPFHQFIVTASRAEWQKPAEFVKANSHMLHRKLAELQKTSANNLVVTNAFGESIEFSTATYEIAGETPAILEGLRSLDGVDEVTSVQDPAAHYRFAWHEAGPAPVKACGEIEVMPGHVRLVCGSRKRLELGRQMLESELGPLVRHLEDRFETVREALDKPREKPAKPPQPIDPELQRDLVLKTKTEHYARWVDTALPALGGKTPREAVATEDGRRRVRDLIRGIENLENRERRQGRPAVDMKELRETLGITEE